MAIQIINEQGHDLGEAAEGRVLIRGASVTQGYLHGVDAEHFLDGGWFDTGDLGFLLDGELYISGRVKDLISRAGVNTSAQRIEWAVEHALGLRPGQVAAFSVIDTVNAREVVVVVVGKRPEASKLNTLRVEVARIVSQQAGVQVDQVVFTTSGRLPKTTSGKIQRSAARQMYVNREFDELKSEA